MDGNELGAELREQLNSVPVRPVIEYVAYRLGLVDASGRDGHWTMTFELADGNLRRAAIARGHIGNVELEAMSKRGE